MRRLVFCVRRAAQHHRAGLHHQLHADAVRELARDERIVLEHAAPLAEPLVVGEELVAVLLEEDSVLARLQLGLLARVVDQGVEAIALAFQLAIAARQTDRQQYPGADDPDCCR